MGLTEFRVRHRDGSDLYAETLRTNLVEGPERERHRAATTRDISERKQFEEQLSHQAFHDQITGLANRALFRDRVSHALERQNARRKARSRSCSWTSTTSRRSTTR